MRKLLTFLLCLWCSTMWAQTPIIQPFAGTTTPGFGGDGGPATAAQLFRANGGCIDPFGNIYVSDSIRIRKISPTGIITTIAGGAGGFSGDGGPARRGRDSGNDSSSANSSP